ncbi:hypothetical protein TRSC58_06331 [Trypanosoma rangeli SC58]|uniref:Dolichol phosphate-mannose biosynthesis regulatory protein n=1 Tax=Trypanosoma rangeli SC58 TaxID=429131 RepID=A0A061IY81_TRYRA|nr:hypothetical protein TRSC58_06331 [Trypanosoma rangeli SC58]
MQLPLPRFIVFTMATVATMALNVEAQSKTQQGPVAPDLLTPLSPSSQYYLIGVISFFVVALATFLGVSALVNIDYSDDTLLMVEVAETMEEK